MVEINVRLPQNYLVMQSLRGSGLPNVTVEEPGLF